MVSKQIHATTPDSGEFLWWRPVPSDALDWRSNRSGVRALVAPKPFRREPYNPMQEQPALYLKFTSLPATEEAFRGFVAQFGLLGLARPSRPETFSTWRMHHGALAVAVRAWDTLRQPRPSLGWIHETPEAVEFFGNDPQLPRILMNRLTRQSQLGTFVAPLLVGLSTRERRRLLGRVWLGQYVNRFIGGGLGPGTTVQAYLVIDSLTRAQALRTVPNTLIAAMWLQMAETISGGTTFKQCRTCRTWFLISPVGAGRRRQALYCRNACKVNASRSGNALNPRKRHATAEG